MRRKVTPMGALKPHKIPSADLKQVQAIYEEIESRPQRREFNLYISGRDEDVIEDVSERVEATGDANAEDNA
jgi:succinate dehydrogenase / fumarate reductase iron-sulfur subunit